MGAEHITTNTPQKHSYRVHPFSRSHKTACKYILKKKTGSKHRIPRQGAQTPPLTHSSYPPQNCTFFTHRCFQQELGGAGDTKSRRANSIHPAIPRNFCRCRTKCTFVGMAYFQQNRRVRRNDTSDNNLRLKKNRGGARRLPLCHPYPYAQARPWRMHIPLLCQLQRHR